MQDYSNTAKTLNREKGETMTEEKQKSAEELRETMHKLEKLPENMQVAVTSYLEGMVAAYDCQRREADE